MEIIAVNLNDFLPKNKFDVLMSYVASEKYKKICKFRKYEDAQRSLIGDILIRYMLCKKLNIENQKLIFNSNEYGKPLLVNYNGFYFNLSHSGEWVVCCVDDFEIGIDIEEIKPIDMSIAEHFFSKKEFINLMCKKEFERESYFYDLWTLKESYIKTLGKGLAIPLDSFNICIDVNNITVCSMEKLDNYYFKQYYVDKSYKLAVCSAGKEFTDEIKIININELYEKFLFKYT